MQKQKWFTSPRFTSPCFTSPRFTNPRFTSRRLVFIITIALNGFQSLKYVVQQGKISVCMK